ncbi:MAG: DUF6442 family protein [Candidatus Spyradocola sp.]
MQKEEILEKSRRENKNQDPYEKQVITAGGNAGAIAAAVLATVFFVAQILTGGGINYGLYAVVFVIPATGFTVKAIRLRRRHEIVVAVIYWVAVLLFSAAHLYQLFTASQIL